MLYCLEIIESLFGFRSRGVPVYQDFYTMKIEAENSGPRHLSGFEGFHCICNAITSSDSIHSTIILLDIFSQLFHQSNVYICFK